MPTWCAAYRLTRTSIALFQEPEGYIARPVDQNERIEFDASELSSIGRMLIEVQWQAELILMFVSDLKSLAIPE